jgi:hypothetical protein
MNKEWHKANKLSPKALLDERIRWHLAHAKQCGCRPIPQSILAVIKKRKLLRTNTIDSTTRIPMSIDSP